VLGVATQRGRSWLSPPNKLPANVLAAIRAIEASLCSKASDSQGGQGPALSPGWHGARPIGVGSGDAAETLLLCSGAMAQRMADAASAPRGAAGYAGVASSFLIASLLSGFQLGVAKGPLCDEPMADAMFLIEEISWSDRQPDVVPASTNVSHRGANNVGCEGETDAPRVVAAGAQGPTSPLSPAEIAALPGQIISAMREACRAAFLDCGTRLMEPVYRCEVQCDQELLGRMYAVLRRRRGEILAEDLREGTALFQISASLPVVESFGFAHDLRKSTSGAAHPQLVFSHFQALQQDPLFVVVTEEEQEALDDGDLPTINLAKKLVDDVRRRKGLRVEDKVVASATKQRTISRKR